MTFERDNIPTGTIVTDAFSEYGQMLTKMQSMEKLPLVVLPHPIAARQADEVRDIAREAFEEVVGSLLSAG
ncbi:MAG: hypothetical protein CMM48_14230 [Rhodospirillaceae bacterium]|nr:hypothetical protein [Rhodospirillaceae bacterium]MBL25045.1 hypothetical protein [Rhodospirillaceae bacterium]HAA93181.1 hypothetical protein [Rhodospirillaceae bacterium]|tara:strand:+ start:260 stop:472 length:213 start_codon:yes stop_codon:yes gene_type:complete